MAKRSHTDPCPLPSNEAKVEITYPNKQPEASIIRPIATDFRRIDRRARLCDRSNISPNGVVLADNFFALHNLIETGTKATLIYLDPPYSTGKDFHSRALEHAYTDQHSSSTYIEYMRRRLVLSREILSADGSIYVHIGHQMVFEMKLLLDEVFGSKNFRNMIVRRKCSSKNYTRKQYANLNDYILFYTKSNHYKWNQPGEKPDEDWIEKEYPKIDHKGRYKLVPVHAPGTRNGETGKEWRGRLPPPGKHWQFTPKKLDDFDAAEEIHWSKNGNPRRKVYLGDDKIRPFTDYWSQFRDAHHQSVAITGYPTEKNLDMLKVIVGASSDEGDLVVDPFCGSGTTLQAAHELGRKWLGIDESFSAIQTSLTRLRHGTTKMGDYVKAAPTVQNLNLFRADFDFYVDADIDLTGIEALARI